MMVGNLIGSDSASAYPGLAIEKIEEQKSTASFLKYETQNKHQRHLFQKDLLLSFES